MHQNQKTYTVDEAKKKLEFYCAYQERCHKEVKQKLRDLQMIPEASDIIIVHLLENNYLNEARFAKMFVSGKFNIKKWGRRRLTLELKKKDISKYNINAALNEINEDDYLNVFNNLVEKRVDAVRETNTFKKKKKIIDYLLYRGWEPHLVYDTVNSLIK